MLTSTISQSSSGTIDKERGFEEYEYYFDVSLLFAQKKDDNDWWTTNESLEMDDIDAVFFSRNIFPIWRRSHAFVNECTRSEPSGILSRQFCASTFIRGMQM